MQDWEFTLERIRSLGRQRYVAEFAVPPAFSAYPGQFVRVSAPAGDGSGASYYTICSAFVDGRASVMFETGPDSDIGRQLVDTTPGTVVPVAGPAGETYYAGDTDVAVLAGGPGFGAALGIGERALSAGHKAAILYADEPLVGHEQLTSLSAAGAEIEVTSDGLEAPVIRTVEAVDGAVYVFGYEPFVERAKRALAGGGYDPAEAHVSNYG